MKPVILCVDDEPIILKTLKSQLKDTFGSKMQYEMAESGEEALELINELSGEGVTIVVIVSDWIMPGINGEALLRKVSAQFPEIGLIVLTGQADHDAIARLRQDLGKLPCIAKPWTQSQLTDAVNSVLNSIGGL